MEDPIQLSVALHFPLSLWLVCFICVTFYCAVFVFLQMSTKYFDVRFWGSDQSSVLPQMMNAIPYILAAFLAPLFGFLVDKFGRSLIYVIVSCFGVTLAQLLMLVWEPESHNYCSTGTCTIPWSPIVGMTIVGTSYSMMAASLWPCVALLVKRKETSTAFGLMTAVQNAGLAIASVLSGQLQNIEEDSNPVGHYKYDIYFFTLCAFSAGIFAILLLINDARDRGMLNATASRKLELMALLETENVLAQNQHIQNPLGADSLKFDRSTLAQKEGSLY